MVVLTTGHQVHCILWEQMAIFNKRIGLLCGLKIFALNMFCEEYLPSSLHLMLQICYKNTVKDVPVNNYEFLNIQASSFRVWVYPAPFFSQIPNGKLLVLSSSLNIHYSFRVFG